MTMNNDEGIIPASLIQNWTNLNPTCPEFVPKPVNYANTQVQPSQTSQGWISRGHTTWQYNICTDRVVGGYYPRIRTKGAYLYDLDAVPFDPKIDVPINVCFNCWQPGHPQQKCYLPKTRTFCDNCGRSNITVDQCPRCATAYNRSLLEIQARKDLGMHYNTEDCEKDALEDSFEMKIEKNEISGQSLSNSVANQTEEGYFSPDGSETFDELIIDESIYSHESSSSFLRDFLILMKLIRSLPMETQNDAVQQFLAERRAQLDEHDKDKD